MTQLGNPRHEQRRNKRLRIDAQKLKAALRWIVGDERGRLYLAHLIDESQVLLAVEAPGPAWLGRRAMGIKLLEDIKALDPTNSKLLAQLMAPAPEPEGETDGGSDADDDAD